jgi:hypothetical protein
MPAPMIPSRNRERPSERKLTGPSPSPTSTSVTGPSPYNSTRCHSRVGSSPASGAIATQKTRLFKYSANRYSTLHSGESSQCGDNTQITASQRVLAWRRASFHLVPGEMPPRESKSRKISLANGGSCSISQCCNAIVCRLSRLEWLKNIRDIGAPHQFNRRTHITPPPIPITAAIEEPDTSRQTLIAPPSKYHADPKQHIRVHRCTYAKSANIPTGP